MDNKEILSFVKERAQKWLGENFDETTRKAVKNMLESDENELVESFYRDLEFGTGGLRGIMGVGTNRMNVYTVGMATQGLSNYLKQQFVGQSIKVAVAHDSRNNSPLFAKSVADIFAANGFEVYLFDALRPTPELSFAIRHYGCQSGVVITASHNPKEYNGYKAYWADGGQVIAPHDTNIIAEVEKIRSIEDVLWTGNSQNIKTIGTETDEVYTDKILKLSLSPEAIAHHKDMKIVYTPIHGSGVKLVPMIFGKLGFTNIIHVPEQDISDGNFPTVQSPNPEESAALGLAIKKATKTGAELVLATDPDSDRVGIAVRDNEGEFVLLNGNQTGSVLIYYLLRRWSETGKIEGKEYIVKTIVTSELMPEMAAKFGVSCYDVLTGFKFIADIIQQKEDKETFIGGGEESYGYLAGDFVRDKDAVMACALIAEAAAWAKEQGKTIYQLLCDIFVEFGLYHQSLLSLSRKGKSGAEEIKQMMTSFRNNPPRQLGGSDVVCLKDYELRQTNYIQDGRQEKIDLPKSNVLQFITIDNTKVTVRPSGTEPKIKFYFEVRGKLDKAEDFKKETANMNAKIEQIIAELKLK
jgi:phosphoglucomutase